MIPRKLSQDDDYDSNPINDNDNPFISEAKIISKWRCSKGFSDTPQEDEDDDNPFE